MIAQPAPPLDGRALARRLSPWFGLQLEFAAQCAKPGGLASFEAVTQYTAIYKRMGFAPNARGPLHADWLALAGALDEASSTHAQLAVLMPVLERRIVGYRHYSKHLFGCFSFDAPNAEGVVKLHFIPDHSDAELGPLARQNREERHDELRAMFAFIRDQHGDAAKTVRGLSWLYNTEAYRSLFPLAFAETAKPNSDRAAKPQGMRYWGQFLTHQGHLRETVAEAFRANFPALTLDRLADAFPYPPATATAPIEVFYDALCI